jgi:hypothetical protein
VLPVFRNDCICTVHVVRSLNLLTPTHAQLYIFKKPFKKLLHVSVYDHLQGVTISSLKSQLFKHSCNVYQVRWCGSISCCLYRLMFVERPSVCVLASTVDDWLSRFGNCGPRYNFCIILNSKIKEKNLYVVCCENIFVRFYIVDV